MKPSQLQLRHLKVLAFLLSALQLSPATAATQQSRRPDPSAYVDLTAYSGKWYELFDSKYDSSGDCVAVKVFYTPQADGTLRLLNQCSQGGLGGPIVSIEGTVRSTNPGNTELKVRFDPNPLNGFEFNYWILWVDPEYQLALLGSPRSLGYTILSRSVIADPVLLSKAKEIARSKGYFDLFTVEIEQAPAP